MVIFDCSFICASTCVTQEKKVALILQTFISNKIHCPLRYFSQLYILVTSVFKTSHTGHISKRYRNTNKNTLHQHFFMNLGETKAVFSGSLYTKQTWYNTVELSVGF